MKQRWPWVFIAVMTLVGVGLRVYEYNLSLTGDELSTLWIVKNYGLADTVHVVKGDAEITPPLYFVLAWLSTQLGSAPELVRLPAMLAGVASIPLMYVLGLRTIGRSAGLIAATLFALSPSMIYFSANGRNYSVMVFLLIASTVTMLAGARTGRTRWWVLFGVATCLAMYSHYTAVFVLGGQLAWLLWAYPKSRRPALIATAVAAVAFLPWLPGMMADLDSPTTVILEVLQGKGFDAKRTGFEVWAFGQPLVLPDAMPGNTVIAVILAGLAVAVGGIAFNTLRAAEGLRERLRRMPREVVLVAVLALATPVCEAILLAFGTDLLGARNLTASYFGLILAFSALLVSAGMIWGTLACVLVIGGFAFSAGKVLTDDAGNPDFIGASDYIEAESKPDDVVIDAFGAGLSPVPLAPMDLYLDRSHPLYPINRPSSLPPFLPFSVKIPSPTKLMRDAFRQAGDRRIYLVKPDALAISSADDLGNEGLDRNQPTWIGRELVLPADARIVEEKRFDSIDPPTVLVIRNGKSGDDAKKKPKPSQKTVSP